MIDGNLNDVNQFVVFTLANETYGVDINSVREIITMQSITQVPGTLGNIEGIINLRGHVIPIFNIKNKFNLNQKEDSNNTRIVVVEVDGNTLGIIVDGVSEVLRITGDVIEKPSSVIKASISSDYIYGIAKIEEQLIILLNLEMVLKNEVNIHLEKIS